MLPEIDVKKFVATKSLYSYSRPLLHTLIVFIDTFFLNIWFEIGLIPEIMIIEKGVYFMCQDQLW